LDLYQVILDGLDALQEPSYQIVVELPDLAGGFLQAGVHIIEPLLKICRHFLLLHQLQLFLLQVVDPLCYPVVLLIKILRDGAFPGVFLYQGQHFRLQLFNLPVIFGRHILGGVAADDPYDVLSESADKLAAVFYDAVDGGHYRFMQDIFFERGRVFAVPGSVLQAVLTSPHSGFLAVFGPYLPAVGLAAFLAYHDVGQGEFGVMRHVA